MMGDHRVRIGDEDYERLIALMKTSSTDMCPADTISRLIIAAYCRPAKRKA
jgi:hypothetical protein